MGAFQTKLRSEATKQKKTPDVFSDDEVMTIIRAQIAHQQAAITYFNEYDNAAQADETKLKIAALQEHLP